MAGEVARRSPRRARRRLVGHGHQPVRQPDPPTLDRLRRVEAVESPEAPSRPGGRDRADVSAGRLPPLPRPTSARGLRGGRRKLPGCPTTRGSERGARRPQPDDSPTRSRRRRRRSSSTALAHSLGCALSFWPPVPPDLARQLVEIGPDGTEGAILLEARRDRDDPGDHLAAVGYIHGFMLLANTAQDSARPGAEFPHSNGSGHRSLRCSFNCVYIVPRLALVQRDVVGGKGNSRSPDVGSPDGGYRPPPPAPAGSAPWC